MRNAVYEPTMDRALFLRVSRNGAWSLYRIYHEGMETGVPVRKGGTGATTAKDGMLEKVASPLAHHAVSYSSEM